uniref:Uncharacterized protein n=1 Tax=Cucumis melo TaxID=3656 RepID=A0A9I9EFM4_CUCME
MVSEREQWPRRRRTNLMAVLQQSRPGWDHLPFTCGYQEDICRECGVHHTGSEGPVEEALED